MTIKNDYTHEKGPKKQPNKNICHPQEIASVQSVQILDPNFNSDVNKNNTPYENINQNSESHHDSNLDRKLINFEFNQKHLNNNSKESSSGIPVSEQNIILNENEPSYDPNQHLDGVSSDKVTLIQRLKQLINEKAYGAVLEMLNASEYKEHSELFRIKLAVLIKLERFKDALEFIKQNRDINGRLGALNLHENLQTQAMPTISYEYCYILYKLKKYKKSLRVTKQLPENERKHVLLSQLYYFLGRYRLAYFYLKKCKYEKERDINLLAIGMMGKRQQKNVYLGEKMNKHTRDKIDSEEYDLSSVSYDIDSLRCGNLDRIAEYNRSFLDYHTHDPAIYIEKYKDCQNPRITQQIGILFGLIRPTELTGKKKLILENNLEMNSILKKELIHKERGKLIQYYHECTKNQSETEVSGLTKILLFLKGECRNVSDELSSE